MAKARKVHIRRRGGKYYQADFRALGPEYYPEGCQSGRKSYRTRAEAEGAAEVAMHDFEASRYEDQAFTPEMRRAAIDAFKAMPGFPVAAIVEAAREYAARNHPDTQRKPLADIFSELLAAQKGSGNSAITIRNYGNYLDRIIGSFGDRCPDSIETRELEAWLDERGISGEHRKNYRRYLRTLFRFAIARHYATRNPAQGLPRVNVRRKMPGIITAAELQILLNTAAEYSGGLMLPYFALCALAGVRPSEAVRLDWAAIDMAKNEIYLAPDVVGKTYQDRFVTMQPSLAAWLSLIPPNERRGRVHWSRRGFEGCRKKCGAALEKKLKATKDILRHSAASNLYAMTKSADLVTANMGHELKVFMRHYKASVGEAEGRAYFDVLPGKSAGELIPLRPAGHAAAK